MIGRLRSVYLGVLAALWHVDQCDDCERPITGEPLVSAEGRVLCEACIWVDHRRDSSSTSLPPAGAGDHPDGAAGGAASSGSFFASRNERS